MKKRLILCYDAGRGEGKEDFSGFGYEDSAYCLCFSQQEERDIHIKARYLLWRAIGEFSGLDQNGLLLERESKGRLNLSEGGSFSFSYGDRAFCLYTNEEGIHIGLDVEPLRLGKCIAERAFSLREREREEKKTLSKFVCQRERVRRWTVKEAVLKAIGKGLWQDPASIETGKWGARFGIVLFEGKSYFWKSFVWQGHWMSIASREKELLRRLERRGYHLPF